MTSNINRAERSTLYYSYDNTFIERGMLGMLQNLGRSGCQKMDHSQTSLRPPSGVEMPISTLQVYPHWGP